MAYFQILPAIRKAKSCTGKVKYDTRKQAAHALFNLVKKRHSGSNPGIETYRCDFCNNFHFGHERKLFHPEVIC